MEIEFIAIANEIKWSLGFLEKSINNSDEASNKLFWQGVINREIGKSQIKLNCTPNEVTALEEGGCGSYLSLICDTKYHL